MEGNVLLRGWDGIFSTPETLEVGGTPVVDWTETGKPDDGRVPVTTVSRTGRVSPDWNWRFDLDPLQKTRLEVGCRL